MNIFLTGATGFLGGRLIQNLSREGHTLYVLARNIKKAEQLLQKTADHTGDIHIIKGDITVPDLSMDKETLKELVNKIDVFYHMAALVKFDLDLKDELFQINYTGTKYALEAAEKMGVSHFYYVSTAYTLGKDEYAEEKLHSLDRSFNNPYEESKCKAEHLCMDFKKFFNVTILRPAIIIGDSKTGEADSKFTLYGLMRSLEVFKKRFQRKGMGDRVFHLLCEEGSTQNLVPVDYVADVLSDVLKMGRENNIYHITNSQPPLSADVFQIMREKADLELFKLAPYDYEPYLSEEEKLLNNVVDVYKNYLNRNIVFEDSNTQQLLQSFNKEPLQMDEEMINRIIKGYHDRSTIK
ncbi:SDR family oxidoreductase [Fictibacillus phosphorivorans]|uniref:SDR family oxidoreductase n=1 Tax=Fictibacillus phosphorivorans TaxID=1221500 RepID=UPI00203D51C4|nr:SDR family oxidoreductase [Fictibacillus phosphorivorans]MCM3720154.1 SDR family oxidoreductase [Fictibacillus phosphorivorans]MCM3777844.1 SDR family oxidoreductase [Fictibacillus phosphorivorans]